jgi:hypothetical protein
VPDVPSPPNTSAATATPSGLPTIGCSVCITRISLSVVPAWRRHLPSYTKPFQMVLLKPVEWTESQQKTGNAAALLLLVKCISTCLSDTHQIWCTNHTRTSSDPERLFPRAGITCGEVGFGDRLLSMVCRTEILRRVHSRGQPRRPKYWSSTRIAPAASHKRQTACLNAASSGVLTDRFTGPAPARRSADAYAVCLPGYASLPSAAGIEGP